MKSVGHMPPPSCQHAIKQNYFFLVLIGIFLSSLAQMFSEAPKYETYAYNETMSSPLDLKDEIPWPSWAIVIAVILVLISILWIPLIAVLR